MSPVHLLQYVTFLKLISGTISKTIQEHCRKQISINEYLLTKNNTKAGLNN